MLAVRLELALPPTPTTSPRMSIGQTRFTARPETSSLPMAQSSSYPRPVFSAPSAARTRMITAAITFLILLNKLHVMKTEFWRMISCGAALLALTASETKSAGLSGAVSSTERTNAAAASGSFLPSLSTDGRFVVFVSHARNLVTNDDLSTYLNVFVRDLAASNTVLISVNGTGFGGGN